MTGARCAIKPSDRSFGACLKSVIFPEERALYLLHLLVVFSGLHYWIGSFRHEPTLPLEIRALYLPEGDTEYVALVRALSRGIVGEGVTLDSFRTGAQAFPLASISLHALSVAAFGSWGFLVADAISAFGYYVVLTAL